jgi:hypothetical protein
MSRLYSDAKWRSDWWVAAVSFVYRDLPDDGGSFMAQLMGTGRDQGHVMSLGGGVVGMAMRVRAKSSATAVSAAEAWMRDNTSSSAGVWRVASSLAFRLGGQADPASFLTDRVLPGIFEKWAEEVDN